MRLRIVDTAGRRRFFVYFIVVFLSFTFYSVSSESSLLTFLTTLSLTVLICHSRVELRRILVCALQANKHPSLSVDVSV